MDPTGGSTDAIFRSLALHIPGLISLAPRPGKDPYSYPPDIPLVQTPTRNYSAADGPKLLQDMGYGNQAPLFSFLQQFGDLATFAPPLVDTFVAYGTGDTERLGEYDISPLLFFVLRGRHPGALRLHI